MKPIFKPPRNYRLKPKPDIQLSTSAFKFNLRRYTTALSLTDGGALLESLRTRRLLETTELALKVRNFNRCLTTTYLVLLLFTAAERVERPAAN
jgi:hypothetical protein